MCGIYGEFSFSQNLNVKTSIEKLNMLQHRGPDGFGFEYGDYQASHRAVVHNSDLLDDHLAGKSNYFLGHRRLSIIDLSDNAFQPMESMDRNYSITFNGEIYNHVELREELVKYGYKFNTDHSDTEVLLYSYLRWGVECLDKLRGMFAFAIYDRKNKSLFIARDRIGQKTVYYELSEKRFAFSSELRPLLSVEEKRNVNSLALNYYVVFGYIPHPFSIFDGICKLPPASYATIDLNNKRMSLHEYWDVNGETGREPVSHNWIEESENFLRESVGLRLRADVSMGAFLSGGTDSTLVVKTIKEILDGQFDLYGADFPNTDTSEKEYIEQAAEKYSQTLNLSSIDLTHIDNIKKVINVFDEPFDGGSSIALFDLFNNASKKQKVILTGDGGDEMFAGYTRYMLFPGKQRIFNLLKNLIFPSIILSILGAIGVKNEKLLKLRDFVQGDLLSNFLRQNNDLNLTGIVKNELRVNSIEKTDFFRNIYSYVKKNKLSPVKALQYLELKSILPGRMLYKLDRFSMYYGVEARSPFLDHKLAEMAFRIPEEQNISNQETKKILKKILEKDFSPTFVYRKKQGFGNPLSFWFRESDPARMFEILLNEKSLIFKYLDYSVFHEYFPELKKGYNGKREKELWRMLVLGHYFENFKPFIKS